MQGVTLIEVRLAGCSALLLCLCNACCSGHVLLAV